jgi:hypothetical protein
MQRQIQNGKLDVTSAVLEKIPTEVDRLYEDRWDALDQDVQTALKFAAGALPEVGEGVVSPFVVEVVLRAVEKSGLLDQGVLTNDVFQKAVKNSGWLTKLDAESALLEFQDWMLASLAFQKLQNDFDDDEIEEYRELVFDETETEVDR